MYKYGDASVPIKRHTFTINTIGDISYMAIKHWHKGVLGVIKIDSNMVERVKNHVWAINNRGYVFERHTKTFLHHLVYGNKIMLDHINRDKFDNTLSNLRPVTKSQNNANLFRIKQNTSGYKGVSFSVQNKKWISQITIDYENIYLGVYTNKEDAALAYDCAAIQLFGDYALLNIL